MKGMILLSFAGRCPARRVARCRAKNSSGSFARKHGSVTATMSIVAPPGGWNLTAIPRVSRLLSGLDGSPEAFENRTVTSIRF